MGCLNRRPNVSLAPGPCRPETLACPGTMGPIMAPTMGPALGRTRGLV